MSQFTGRQHKGAMQIRREVKRNEAEARNVETRPERRSWKNPANELASISAHTMAR